jgi:hypothetical protein
MELVGEIILLLKPLGAWQTPWYNIEGARTKDAYFSNIKRNLQI